LGDDRLRGGAVAGLTEPHERAAREQLPELVNEATGGGRRTPDRDAHVMTLRRDRRSPMTPRGSAASDNTMMYAEPSQPSCTSEIWRSRLIGSNTA